MDYAYEDLAPEQASPSASPPADTAYKSGIQGLRPLSITIPNTNDNYEASPPNSPAGTISVPNSCPTSPNSHRVFNPYSQYRPSAPTSGQATPSNYHIELEEAKPDLGLHMNTHNAVVYPTEDGGLSTVPVGPSPPHPQVNFTTELPSPKYLIFPGRR